MCFRHRFDQQIEGVTRRTARLVIATQIVIGTFEVDAGG
ncbi:hypothetical protein X740_26170 [Mesorhizobium sp. LNHC221B00]|nr:hypothetical protein X740_26170 [Mesorhizobium sp. LNHC221B00]